MNTHKTVKRINANGTMSNLVGLWARIRCEKQYTVFIYGKASDDYYLVQAVSALSGQPNVMRIVHLMDMLEWSFFADSDILQDDLDFDLKNGKPRYALDIPNQQSK